VSKHAAEQRPDTEAQYQEPGPSAGRYRPALWSRTRVDCGQSAGYRERCRETLQRPAGEQSRLLEGGGNDARRTGEQRQSDQCYQP